MIAGNATSLLQEFTRHKLDAALETVDFVSTKSHPFPESLLALEGIARHLGDLRQRVTRPNTSDLIAKNYCRVALEQLAETIPLVGFVDRSAEVSGPVEFHDPFSRVVRSFLGGDAKLILSSMWNFSPYTITYPDEVPKYVEDFVYVSFSVTEADNAILTPLAAHELGHNIWKKENFAATLKARVGAEIVRLIQTEFAAEWSRVGNQAASAGDLVGQVAWQPAHFWAMKQLEESFCDFVGLFLFGPSYLYAFAHFISPGLNAGEPKYPQAFHRFVALLEAANPLWSVDPAFTRGLFDASVRPPEVDTSVTKELLMKLADRAREALLADITQFARSVVQDAGLLYSADAEAGLLSELDQGIPCAGAPSIMAVVNAGWGLFIKRFYRSSGAGHWGFAQKDLPKVFNELILKSFEIFEIEQRLKDEGECSMQAKLPT